MSELEQAYEATADDFLGRLGPELRARMAGKVGDGADESYPTVSPEDEADALGRRSRALTEAVPSHYQEKGCLAGLTAPAVDAGQVPGDLQAWLDNVESTTLLLAGPTGSGKTQAAYAVAAQAAKFGAMMVRADRDGQFRPARRNLLVRATTATGYVQALEPGGSPLPRWEVRKLAIEAELLVVDELGADLDGAASEFARRELANLLDARQNRMLRTVFTTNLRSVDLEAKLADRMWTRLHERSSLVVLNAADRRKRGRKMAW